ncbi:MAG: fimbrial protein [Rikenellaceae bacterium]
MKKLLIYMLIHLTLLAVGCTRDAISLEEVDTAKVVITMNVYNNSDDATRATSTDFVQAGILGSGEYIIDRLRVYVFASDGTLDKMELYDGLGTDQLIGQQIEVPKDLSKEIYFVANEPSELSSTLALVTSADELKNLSFTIADAMNRGFNAASTFSSDDFLIPMTAFYGVENAMSDLNIHVGLSRAVARVDLYLNKGDDATSRSVELNGSSVFSTGGVTRTSSLFEGDLSSVSPTQSLSVASSDVTISTDSRQRLFSFYTAERTYDYTDATTNITIEVDGLVEAGERVGTKSVTLGDGGTLTEINRNHIYQINATYNGTEIVADGFEIIDWEDVEVDGEIEGVMVAVDSEVAMDWLRNGNSYTSKTISFGSNKAISFYLPVITSSQSDPTPEYEFTLFEFEDMSAGQSYDLREIGLTNNYIFATSWIQSATIHFTSAQSGYIEFVYAPVRVSYKIQSYPIRIKSDNVTKQMKAVYDNGYIPSSMLSDDWAKRAPGGVVFAKRGEANHPVTTPEILYCDDDGYYRGEYQTTAEEASEYCAERFGDGWYAPSYSDMQEIASWFDMLGVSYRFQNNGSAEGSGELTESRYWTSSASSEYQGWYWTADFMSRDYMIEGLMERRDGSENYFVRCVMDLE